MAWSPQPYPANLMVGFYATADSSQLLHTDLDNELEDAKWYTREEVLAVIGHKDGMHLSRGDHRKIADAQQERAHVTREVSDLEERNMSRAGTDHELEVPFRIPPLTAIAGVLVRDWALERAGPGGHMGNSGRQFHPKL